MSLPAEVLVIAGASLALVQQQDAGVSAAQEQVSCFQ